MNATPDNTAVVTILAYKYENVPVTYGFMFQSAEKLGIKLNVFGRNEDYENHLETKVKKLCRWIEKLPEHIEYVLYIDARDILFAHELSLICLDYNSIGAPILMSAETGAYPGRHIEWEARFPKFESGFNYNNAGCFMGHRKTLVSALKLLLMLSEEVKAGRTIGHQNYWNDDQFLWQLAYVQGLIPLELDHEQKIFVSMTHTPFKQFRFESATKQSPIVLANGSKPSVLHFPGPFVAEVAIPFAAWTLQLCASPQGS